MPASLGCVLACRPRKATGWALGEPCPKSNARTEGPCSRELSHILRRGVEVLRQPSRTSISRRRRDVEDADEMVLLQKVARSGSGASGRQYAYRRGRQRQNPTNKGSTLCLWHFPERRSLGSLLARGVMKYRKKSSGAHPDFSGRSRQARNTSPIRCVSERGNARHFPSAPGKLSLAHALGGGMLQVTRPCP